MQIATNTESNFLSRWTTLLALPLFHTFSQIVVACISFALFIFLVCLATYRATGHRVAWDSKLWPDSTGNDKDRTLESYAGLRCLGEMHLHVPRSFTLVDGN